MRRALGKAGAIAVTVSTMWTGGGFAATSGAVAPKPSAGCGHSTAGHGEERIETTSSTGTTRWYLREVPPSHDGKHPLPLVVDLHGYVEGAAVHTLDSGLSRFGDRHGFITVTPQGLGPVAHWEVALDSPDVQFVGDVLDEVERQTCVDRRRVFVTGMSMGAFFTSTLACSLADRIAAAAPVAGIRDPRGCRPSRPVPVVAFHGTSDPILSYEGELGPLGATLPAPEGSCCRIGEIWTGPSVPEMTAAWAHRNGCSGRTTTKPIGSDVTLIRFRCPRHADVELYRIDGGGHTWPGSRFWKGSESLAGRVTFTVDANKVMWDFFRRHPLRAGH